MPCTGHEMSDRGVLTVAGIYGPGTDNLVCAEECGEAQPSCPVFWRRSSQALRLPDRPLATDS